MSLPQTRTAALATYQRLRRDIILGLLAPEERLRINDVCERYDCGAIPAREALSRLAAEALIVYSEHVGFAVAPVSKDDLEDLGKARSWVAEITMREAVIHGDQEWEERVLLAYHRLGKVPRYDSVDPPTPNPAFDAPHRIFHTALFSGCPSRWMIDTCERMFDYAERYRNLSRRAVVIAREDEHKAIVDAALARDVALASALMKEHFALTSRLLMDPTARLAARS